MGTPLSLELTAELEAFLCLGPSLLVTSRNARLLPSLTRVGGARLGQDGLLRLAIPVPEGQACLADFADNGCVALTAALPATYQTFQIKGNDARVLAWPELEEVARQHTHAFVQQVLGAGLPAELGQAMWSKRYVALAFTPHEIFNQTPGPGAGAPLS